MIAKKPVSILIFGIISIIWGISGQLAIIIKTIKIINGPIWSPSFLDIPQVTSMRILILIMLLIVFLYFSCFFVIGGIGILRLKPWGRALFLELACLCPFLLVLDFFTFGPFRLTPLMSKVLFPIFFSGLILCYFNKDNIKVIFSISKDDLKKDRKCYLTFIISTVFYILLYFCIISFLRLEEPLIFRTPQKISYKTYDEKSIPQGYKKRFLPGYNLYLPSDFCFKGLTYDQGLFRDSGELNIVLGSNNKVNLRYRGRTSFDDVSPIFKVLLFNTENPYEGARRFIYCKWGIVPLFLKKVCFFDEKMKFKNDEISFGDWKGFLQTGASKVKTVTIYMYSLWNKKSGKSLELDFPSGPNFLTANEIQMIVGSLNFSVPEKSAEAYFQEGVNLFNSGNYEEAKFNFAYALYQDQNNPQYYYYLGYVFLNTKKINFAKINLEKAISLQSNFPEAQELLSKIKLEEKR